MIICKSCCLLYFVEVIMCVGSVYNFCSVWVIELMVEYWYCIDEIDVVLVWWDCLLVINFVMVVNIFIEFEESCFSKCYFIWGSDWFIRGFD